jgi:hypothetical protein
MPHFKLLSIAAVSLVLLGCSPPSTGISATSSGGASLTELTDKVQGAADSMETFGDGVSNAAQYAGDKLETLGNFVLDITGGGPQKHTD